MAKLVGMSRNIKLTWLKKTVELLGENLCEEDFKERLNAYLSFEIKSATNLRKTREILMHIWYYPDENLESFRQEAIAMLRKYPEYDLPIHWCMILLVYPIFADAVKVIGRMSEFQDEITTAQIKQKIYDEWGERTTLYHSLDKLISTLKDFGVITAERAGHYKVNHATVDREEIICLMIYTAMKTDAGNYYLLDDLTSFEYLFPFKYQIRKEYFLTNEHFSLANFNGQLTIGRKN